MFWFSWNERVLQTRLTVTERRLPSFGIATVGIIAGLSFGGRRGARQRRQAMPVDAILLVVIAIFTRV